MKRNQLNKRIVQSNAIKQKYGISLLLFILVLFPFVMCSSGANNADTQPPAIISIYPERGATDIPINTNIIITFNKSIINVNSNTVYLEKLGVTGKVPATIQYDDASKTVTLDPLVDLDYNTVYYVTITNDIRSKAGVALSPESWAFATGIEADVEKPTIIDKSPAAQYYVDISTPIYVVFSESVNNISNATVFIKKEGQQTVEATIDYNPDIHKVQITPAQPLEEWVTYTVYCTDTITDNAGNTLDAYQFSFKTNDTHNPTIVSQYPDNGATGISTNAVISVTFSESIKSYTVTNTNNFKLEKWTGATWEAVDSIITYNDTTKTALCYPDTLESNTQYRVTLFDNIRDLAHNPLDNAPIDWTFTTADVPDTTQPSISSKSPDDGTENIPTDTAVTVTFSEDVINVGTNSFIIERVDTNEQVQGTIVYNPSMREATFTPGLTLYEGVWYRVRLTSAIKDNANNALDETSWQFKTADNTKPCVSYRYPSINEGNVSTNISIIVTFSENITGVNELSFTLQNAENSSYIAGTVTYNDALKTATFTPSTALLFETTYKVILTSDIKDLNNNTLNITEWQFITGSQPDTTAPYIISSYPDFNSQQQNIPVSASMRIDFNEPVSGIGPATILLKEGDANGTLISAMINYDAIAKRANITPNNNLKYDQLYTIIVKGGDSTDIKDVAGNKLASDVIWSFRTTPDTTPPVVTFKTPDEGTPDIPGNAVEVRVIFSEKVQNVNENTFKLIRISDSYEVPCSVQYSYDTQNNIASATLVPLSNITTTGTYKVSLTNAITDLSPSQNHLSLTEWTFSITALDEEAPTVVLKTPAGGASNWNTKVVQVVFSEDVRGVSGSSFYIKDQYNVTIPAVVTYNQGLQTAELTVLQDLPYETTYTAYLTSAIKDRANNSLLPESWSFNTPADNIPPQVVSVYPPHGTSSYPVNGQIQATFSEPIQGYNSSSFYLDPAISASIVYDNQNKTLTLLPNGNLQGNTTYTVHITTAITDQAQMPNHLLNEYTWQFTTQPVPDTTPPEVVASSRYPAPGATNVALNTNLSVQFSEHVVNATTKIQLKKGTSNVPVNITYNPQTFVATLDPVNDLEQNTNYTVIVLDGPTGILDSAGNYLQPSSVNQWSFTTQPDVTPPAIIYRYPVPGATNIPLKPVITVTFSEPVVNVNTLTFTLTGSNVPTCYVVYDESTRTATLTPGSELQNNATYTVTLSNTIKDRYNNALPLTTWQFTTYSLPQITNIQISTNNGASYSTITDGATGINRKLTNVRITFNRPMNTQKQWLEIYEGASGSTTPSPLTPDGYSWSADYTQITYTLIGQCRANTQYQFKLYGWGGSFEDPDGNRVSKTAYVGDGILNFTAGADTEPPLVIATIPYNGSTNIGRDIGKIIIRFNEMMNQSRDSRITLNPAVTATRTGWIEGGRTVVFTIPQLTANTTYTVTLNSGTNSFQDLASNNAQASGQVICTFTTGSSTGSTNLIFEGFEDYNNPYFTSFKNISSDNADWQRVTNERAGNGTNLIPQQGSYFAKASSFEWNDASYADIVSAGYVDLSTAGSYLLEFTMYHERLYNAVDRLEVLLSVNGVDFNPVQAGAFMDIYRYDWSFADNNPVWHTHYVDLSSFSGSGYNTVWIKLRAYSAGDRGMNVIIDNVKLVKY